MVGFGHMENNWILRVKTSWTMENGRVALTQVATWKLTPWNIGQ